MLDMSYDKVVDICTNNDIESMIDIFLDPRDFKKKCRIVSYNLVFLDISMTPIDGLEIAEYLNTYYTDTKIVFVTSYDNVVDVQKDYYRPLIRKYTISNSHN